MLDEIKGAIEKLVYVGPDNEIEIEIEKTPFNLIKFLDAWS